MSRFRCGLITGFALTWIACIPADDREAVRVSAPVSQVSGQVSAVDGTLVPVPTGQDAVFAVPSPDGAVAVFTNADAPILWFDDSLELVASGGVRGEGPGELTSAIGFAAFRGPMLVVWTEGRLIGMDSLTHPRQHRTWQIDPGLVPTYSAGAGLVFWAREGQSGGSILWQEFGSRSPGEVWLTAADSFFAAVMLPVDGSTERRRPIVAALDSTLVIADGYGYRLMRLDLRTGERLYFGRSLEARRRTPTEMERLRDRIGRGMVGPDGRLIIPDAMQERLERMASEPLPHFRPGGVGIVGEYVFVAGQAEDRGFLDTFRHGEFMGRSVVPCPQFDGAVVAGLYLVARCGIPPDSDGREIEIRRWLLSDSL
jgi:hypothetical protein